MKWNTRSPHLGRGDVAPHAGAWIEMLLTSVAGLPEIVAPHAGAWIEIKSRSRRSYMASVAPPRGGVD